jgi:hypothetical protein
MNPMAVDLYYVVHIISYEGKSISKSQNFTDAKIIKVAHLFIVLLFNIITLYI